MNTIHCMPAFMKAEYQPHLMVYKEYVGAFPLMCIPRYISKTVCFHKLAQ